MSAIADVTATIDTQKVAVLAALAIATNSTPPAKTAPKKKNFSANKPSAA